jgi:hypothetical protein
MVRECPNCKLVNPPTAEVCDCGYDFLHPGPVRRPPRQGSAAAGCLGAAFGTVLGPVLGLVVAVAAEPGDRFGRIIYMIEGAIGGALIGPVVGVFAGMLLSRWFRYPSASDTQPR